MTSRLAVLLTGWITLDKLVTSLCPSFFNIKMRIVILSSLAALLGIHKIRHCKAA